MTWSCAFRCRPPTRTGRDAIDLARVEIYAITIAQGADTPPNRDLLANARIVGTIAVRPPPVEGESAEPGTPADKRPGPGDRVTFVDQLTARETEAGGQQPGSGRPVMRSQAAGSPTPRVRSRTRRAGWPGRSQSAGEKPEAGAVTPEGAVATVPAVPPVPAGAPYPTRIYAIRGLSRSGRPGLPSTRVVVPLSTRCRRLRPLRRRCRPRKRWSSTGRRRWPNRAGRRSRSTSTAATTRAAPLNPSPLSDVKFETGNIEYGREQCFVVRTVQTLPSITLESAPSAPGCLTPLDKFPPAAPKGLRAVAEDGAVSLVWDRNGEADLGGYLVLRGEAPGDTLLPLTGAADRGRDLPRRDRHAGSTIRLRGGRRGQGHAEEPERAVRSRRSDRPLTAPARINRPCSVSIASIITARPGSSSTTEARGSSSRVTSSAPGRRARRLRRTAGACSRRSRRRRLSRSAATTRTMRRSSATRSRSSR